MAERKSLHIPGNFHRGQPVPVATRLGPIVTSGGISPLDPSTNASPRDPAEQVHWVFEHMRQIMAQAGGSPNDIVHINFYVQNRDIRTQINEEWEKLFPDPESRPTRHTIEADWLGSRHLVGQFTAYIDR